MTRAFFDGEVGLTVCGRVFAGFWRGPFTHDRLRALREISTALHRGATRPLGMIAVFDSDAIKLATLTDQALRRDAAKLQTEFLALFSGGQSIVLEGTGFAVAAMRATALAVQAISRRSATHVFHADATGAVVWLKERMDLTLQECDDIARAIERTRIETRPQPRESP